MSTLADQVGHGTFAVMPLFHLIERHVLAAERLHGDDTTIRILAKSKCTTGRIWTYVRDDRPFNGHAPPAAVYYALSDRRGEHPQKHLAAFAGILQADCYNGFEPLLEGAADHRIDALFEIERAINGRSGRHFASPMRVGSSNWPTSRRMPARARRESRSPRSRWRRSNRWIDFPRFIDDGRICLSNNAAERALRGIALGRRRGGKIGDTSEDLGEPGFRVDVVEACRGDEGKHDGGAVGAALGTGECPVAA